MGGLLAHASVSPLQPSDLFLSPDLTEQQASAYLRTVGFVDPEAADRHLRLMAEDPAVREALAGLATELFAALSRAPDPDAALVGFSRYLAARAARLTFLSSLRDDPLAIGILVELFGTSPFLGEILIRNPEYFHWLMSELDRPPAAPDARASSADFLEHAGSTAALDALKRVKRQQTLKIAARDILDREALEGSMLQVSALADFVIERALRSVTHDRLTHEGLAHPPGAFAVIGMGKLGGEELNYSSDIDLIYVYEPDDEDDSGAHEFFDRLARKLNVALTEYTQEGYLYRVDLRLRPMGRSGNIAHSLKQLKEYYEGWAVTFERFAMIKARAVAGDRRLGMRVVSEIEPFVYRAYLDHAALEEMYQHKARVDRAITQSERDRNVKLGRGGIREVELFTQVLQLTYGARHLALRQRNTLAALEALGDAGLAPASIVRELSNAYRFLRTVEHRLQIVQERQTHTLSSDRHDLAVCARRLRFADAEALESALSAHRSRVHELYSGLFERRRGASHFAARQFFRLLGDELSADEARAHLSDHGFANTDSVLDSLRALGAHALRASAPATARNVLANLLAASAPRLARCAQPSVVLMRLEQLATQAGGAALFARSLLENEPLREALIDILDLGDLLALRLIQHPELLDSIAQPPTSLEELRESLDARFARLEPRDRDGWQAWIRRVKRNEEFKALVDWLSTSDLDCAQEKLSLLARRCTTWAARWVAPCPPDDPKRSWAIAALGKLGGAELTVHSDLDLVVIYDDETGGESDVRWQTFVERLQGCLSDPTSDGVAYRVDTRLRPEGTKGPLAIPVAAFERYLANRAEWWERLAWTRARVLAGSPRLTERISRAVDAFVYGPWDPALPATLHKIRMRMEHELAKEGPEHLDFKLGRGGLADVDFLVQLVQIREGHARPAFRLPGARRLLAALPSTAYITEEETIDLKADHALLRTIELLVRLDADSNVSWIVPNASALVALGTRMGLGDAPGARLLSRYTDVTSRIRSTYSRVLERLSGHTS